MTKNMTQGSPTKLILGFALPMLMGLLFQQFYSMADTIIVGRWLGIDALSAVGSTGAINFMIIGFCTGVCSGFAIPVAQKFGSKDENALRKFFANAIWLSIFLATVMTILVCVFCMDILEIMQTPSDIIEEAYEYIFIIFLGIPMTYLYNLLSGVIRSLGDSKSPVIFLTISAVLNIVLDIFMIVVLKMGVDGAAWATVISQGVSGLLCLIFIVKKFDILHLSEEEWKFDFSYIKILFSIGVPMGLQYSVTAIGSVICQTSVNILGKSAVAAVTAGNRINSFFICAHEALGVTMATYTGQNIGAGETERVKKGLKSSVIIGFIYSFTMAVIILFFGKWIIQLFIESTEVEVISQAHQLLIVNSFSYFLLVLVNTVRFSIQGMGYSMFAITAGILEMIGRSAMAFLVTYWGYTAVCFASPFAWLLADFFLVPAFFYCIKRVKEKI